VDVLEVVTGSTVGSLPDLLRLAVVPVFGWAAWRDVKTRRVPNRTWLPLLAVGLLALAIEAWQVWTGNTPAYVDPQVYLLRVTISLGFVVPLAYGFWWIGGFGGADAKALITLAVVFPTFPTYYLPTEALPVVVPTLGVFAMTVLSNTVVVGIFYPVALTLRNAVAGHVAKAMVIGRPVTWDGVPTEYGRLLETPEGFTRRGLDLDALRMYLTWRGATLTDLRTDPARFRDPAALPEDRDPPGDGSIPATDGGADAGTGATGGAGNTTGDDSVSGVETAGAEPRSGVETTDDGSGGGDYDDPWAADQFLEEIEGSAYGTSPDQLRDGLAVLAAEDEMWITPGIPFLVPMFLGLVVGLTYGDVLFAAVEWAGFF